MRNRVAVLAAVLAFAVVVGGVAVLATRSGSDSSRNLPRLPFATTGAEGSATTVAGMKADAALMPYPVGGIEYRIGADLPDLGDHAAAYRRAAPTQDEIVALARAVGIGGPAAPTKADDAWTVSDGVHGLRVDARSGQWFFGPDPSQPVSGTAISKCAPCPPDAVCADVCQEPTRPEGLPTKDEAEQAARAFWSRAGVSPGDAKIEIDDNFSQWYVHFAPRVGGREVVGADVSVAVGVKSAIESANGWLGDVEKLGDYPLITLKAAVDRLNESVKTGPPCLYGAVRCLPAQDAPLTTETTVPLDERGRCVGSAPPAGAGSPTTFATVEGCEPPAGSADGSTGSGGTSTGSTGSAGGSGGATGSGGTSTGSTGGSTGSTGGSTGSTGGGSTGVGVAPPGTVVSPEPTTLPGSTTVVPPTPVVMTITGARLALQAIDQYLVPVYIFSLKEGGETPPVPAVPDRLLQTTTTAPPTGGTIEPQPKPIPAPAPTGKPEPAPAPAPATGPNATPTP